jgi:hypothetical protein
MSDSYFDLYAGGVPPGEVFRSNVEQLIALAGSASNTLIEGHLPHLCLIGLHAYFETFCKDQFSTLINIHPDLVLNLKIHGHDVSVDASKFITHAIDPRRLLGFLIAEKFDFGTAKKINALYHAILQITPFSKDDIPRYSDMLADRNLIVHHGGTYTSQYLEQHGIPDVPEKFRVYMDSLVISATRFESDAKYLKSIARKIVRASHDALVNFLETNDHEIEGDTKSALFMMRWWGDEGA